MRSGIVLSMMLMMGTSAVAFSPAAFSQTLDEQMQRLNHGQPAVSTQTTTMQRRGPTTTTTTTTNSEWPAGAVASPSVNPVTTYNNSIDSQGEGAIPPLPLIAKTSNNINFITGGIGDEELAELRSLGGNYNVQLLISGAGGEYLSEATVAITDASGSKLLTADNVGPYFYVSLPAGKYTFDVSTRQGGSKTANVNAPASGAVKPNVRFTE